MKSTTSTTRQKNSDTTSPDTNPDPITQAPGFHPIGTGMGAAAGSVAGAAIGTVAGGPAGGVIGAAVGGVAGGLTGKAAAEAANPTAEDAYWRNEYSNRPYYDETVSYDDISPAYRTGYEGYGRHSTNGRSFEEVEAQLRSDYEKSRGSSSNLGWDNARGAARDAWRRVEKSSRNGEGSMNTGSNGPSSNQSTNMGRSTSSAGSQSSNN